MSLEKRGDRYVARTRIDGKQTQRTFATKKAAETWLAETAVDVSRGVYIAPADTTFAEFAEAWLCEAEGRVRRSTAQEYRRRVDKVILPVVGNMRLIAITRPDCAKVIASVRHLSPLGQRNIRQSLNAILDTAVEDRLIPSNPCKGVQLPPQNQRRRDIPTGDEVEQIVAAFRPNLQAMVRLAAATGMRSSELCGLRIEDITPAIHLSGDFIPQRGVVRVERSIDRFGQMALPKSQHGHRSITVGADVMLSLIVHVATYGHDGFLFVRPNGQPYTSRLMSREWELATKGMNRPKGDGMHGLRHRHASTLLASGINIAAVSRRLGHSSPVVTLASYSWAMPGDEDRILDALRTTQRGG